MYQIDNSTAATVLPAPTAAGTPGYYTDGNPGTGVPATVVPAEHLNAMMMEILNAITGAGITPDKTALNQLSAAIRKAATTTFAGVVQLADSATILAGTDSAKAATAASLLAGLLGAGGGTTSDYIILPYRDKTSGARKNLIVQWGPGITGSDGSSTITFPIAFPTGPLAYWANVKGIVAIATSYVSAASAPSWTGTQGKFWANQAASGIGFNWVAIGN